MSTVHDTSNSTGAQQPDVVNASTFFIAASLVPIIGICIALTLSFINRHLKHISLQAAQPKYKVAAAKVAPITAEQMQQLTAMNHNQHQQQPVQGAQPLPAAAIDADPATATTAPLSEGGDTETVTVSYANARVLPVAYSDALVSVDEDDSGAVEIDSRDDGRDEKRDSECDREDVVRRDLAFDHDNSRVNRAASKQTLPTPSVSFDVTTPVPARRYSDVHNLSRAADEDEWNDDDLDTASILV